MSWLARLKLLDEQRYSICQEVFYPATSTAGYSAREVRLEGEYTRQVLILDDEDVCKTARSDMVVVGLGGRQTGKTAGPSPDWDRVEAAQRLASHRVEGRDPEKPIWWLSDQSLHRLQLSTSCRWK